MPWLIKQVKEPSPWLIGTLLGLGVLISLFPLLFHSGIPFGHDASFHLSRIQALSNAFSQGVFYPGIYTEYFKGYGYGAGLFYPDFFLSIPAVFTLWGCSGTTALKLYFVIANIATGVIMFYSVGRVYPNQPWISLISAYFYLFCSYHTTNLYYRCAVGELTAMAFIPLIIAGLWEICEKNGHWGMLTLGFSGVILSHVLSAVIMALFCLAIFLLTVRQFIEEPSRFLALLKAAGATFLISAFFTLPLFEQLWINPIWGDTGLLGSVSNWAVSPVDAILSLPVEHFGREDVPPAGVGVILLIMGILGCTQRRRWCFETRVLFCGFFSLWMTTTLFPWGILAPYFQNLQFPWRFYGLTSGIFCFFSGECLYRLPKGRNVLCPILCLTVLTVLFFWNTTTIYSVRGTVSDNPFPSFPAGCEYLPKEMVYGELLEHLASNQWGTQTDYYSKKFTISQIGWQTLPIIYYPGYSVQIEGLRVETRKNSSGFLEINSNRTGEGTLQFIGTPLRRWSVGISMVSSVILGGVFIGRQVRREKRQ
ncbi:hypothetical protein [Eubacterium barkeri]|uniref:Membrane protein 6-pyruvoyl-tetrahydropterin synthase-related domain-containing protein n=1 Tax=Eubacterium barkeri TaxID=1528 RepID=A0A1H3BZK0_EUBBA|nr:hypothetical protein [Eubacterium barkeri]SDX47362.1 hypothetical protein SAMN04488579_102277 [Eubacterium barkeri]